MELRGNPIVQTADDTTTAVQVCDATDDQ